MSLMADDLFQSGKQTFLTKMTNNMFRELGSSVFGLKRPK